MKGRATEEGGDYELNKITQKLDSQKMKVQEHAFHSWNIIILRKALKNILRILLLISKNYI